MGHCLICFGLGTNIWWLLHGGKFIVSYCCYDFYLCIFLLVVLLFALLRFTFCVKGVIKEGVFQFFSLLLVGVFTAWAKNLLVRLGLFSYSCFDFCVHFC